MIYQNGKVVHTLDAPEDFQHGVSFKNDTDQLIHVRLLNKMNFQLYVKVDDLDYVLIDERPVEIMEDEVPITANVRPLTKWFIAVLAIQLINFMALGDADNQILLLGEIGERALFRSEVGIYPMWLMAFISIAYFLTIYYLHDNRGRAYFLGFPILLIYTILELICYITFDGAGAFEYPIVVLVGIMLKVVLSGFLLTKIPSVVNNLNANGTRKSGDLLD